MELIRDTELGIVGERYGSFLEVYRVNDRRRVNDVCAARGEGFSQALFEADEGIVFTPEETREALLYGSDLYSGRYKEMRKRVRKTLRERYEWMDEDRFGADVRGEHVIMERYAIGHPEAFHRKRSTVRQERSVEILYDAMCPASTPVGKRIEAGCIVAACADALERIGYKVAIDFGLATYDGNSMSDDPTLLLEVALKGYGDALNVKRLEFPLAAKPVLFHLGVWWAHRFPGTPSDFGEGEGYPVSYDARRVRALEEYARRRHGAYLSEDIIEMQLSMDPTKALERILGAVGEAEVLEQHMVGKSTMQASESPAQGKLFGGTRRPEPEARRAPGEGGAEEDEPAPGRAGVGGAAAVGNVAGGQSARGHRPADPSDSDASGNDDTDASDRAPGSEEANGVDGAPGHAPDAAEGAGAASGEGAAGTDEAGASAAGGGDGREHAGAAEGAGGDAGPEAEQHARESAGGAASGPSGAGRPAGGPDASEDAREDGGGSDDGGLSGSAQGAAGDAGGDMRAGGDGGAMPAGGDARRPEDGVRDDTAPGGAGAGPNSGGAGASGPGEAAVGSDGSSAGRAGAAGSRTAGPGGGNGPAGAASGSGPSSPSSSGAGASEGGGGSGERSAPDDSGGDGEERGRENDGQREPGDEGDSMSDDSRDEEEAQAPGAGASDEGPRGENESPDDAGGDAGTDDGSSDEEEQADHDDHQERDENDDSGKGRDENDDSSDNDSDGAEDDEPERESFIVELRRRYVRFESGDYRRAREREQREAQTAAGGAGDGRGPVKAPPVAAVTGNDDYEFGTPRSSPFSMTYVPKRKG